MENAATTVEFPPEENPVGVIRFPTSVAYTTVGGGGMFHNRDNLAGPPNPTDPPWIWGTRVTIPGSNGYKHEPYWVGFKRSWGTACDTTGPIGDNRMVTWVRVESIEIAEQKGPDAYGPSR